MPGLFQLHSPTITILASSLLWSVARSSQSSPLVEQRHPSPIGNNNHHHQEAASQSGISSRAFHDPAFLPAQIGGIVAAYGISLVLVAITLLSLAKTRREHLEAEEDRDDTPYKPQVPEGFQDSVSQFSSEVAKGQTLPAPNTVHYHGSSPLVPHYPVYPVVLGPGLDPSVDQGVVAADKAMANQQLEDMYRHVMEHEDAKERGHMYHQYNAPHVPAPSQQAPSISEKTSGKFFRKGKSKPSSLELRLDQEDKSQSRASTIFSSLLSPKKKPSMRGLSISSPIMTPMSASFPHHESQEMNPIATRNYAPHPPPTVPTEQFAFGASVTRAVTAPTPPDHSPESVLSIDERIGLALEAPSRHVSYTPSPIDPGSAISEHSQVPLVGLPSSPRLGGRFPSLPASPKPGATFRRPSATSAVRTNGTLPLRAFEEANGTPSIVGQTTKQTVFERRGPLSPGGGRTPLTANPVPYTPYQPFTPCIPVTPSLVTKEDRKRLRRMVPKTPTLAMVQSSDEMW